MFECFAKNEINLRAAPETLKSVCHTISFQQKQQQKTSKRRGKGWATSDLPAERWQGATGTRAKPAVRRSPPASSRRGGDGEAENLSPPRSPAALQRRRSATAMVAA